MSKFTKRTNIGLIVTILLIYIAFVLFRPLPSVSATTVSLPQGSGESFTMPWPDSGQAAIGTSELGVLASTASQKSVPTASIAKVITAMAVLQKKPIKLGEQGPILTMTDKDTGFYNDSVTQNGSVVPVNVGEQISEYQMLQAMLLPSGNNIAESLATWAFGSVDNYNNYANQLVSRMGLKHTHITDPSGLAPSTVSTANDLIVLGQSALSQPVIASIVSQAQATLPVVGMVSNVNALLGQDSVIGIKTGNSDQAGGCLLFASRHSINGQNVTVVGAVMGVTDIVQAFKTSRRLIDASFSNLEVVKIVSSGQVVGYYRSPWGTSTSVKAAKDLSIVHWKGNNFYSTTHLDKLNVKQSSGSLLGNITVSYSGSSSSVNLILDKKLPGPSLVWRLQPIHR